MIDRSRKMNAEIGSTALSNHRRQLFAQLLVLGFTELDAYEKATIAVQENGTYGGQGKGAGFRGPAPLLC